MAAREAEWEELASNQFFSFTFLENFDLNEVSDTKNLTNLESDESDFEREEIRSTDDKNYIASDELKQQCEKIDSRL